MRVLFCSIAVLFKEGRGLNSNEMATSATAGGAGEPHWLDEKVTKEFLKNKVRLDDQDAEQVYQKLNENQIRNVRTLLGFSEERLVNQIGLTLGSAKDLRNYIEGCEVDETFLTNASKIPASSPALEAVTNFVASKNIVTIGQLISGFQSEEELQNALPTVSVGALWGFIEKNSALTPAQQQQLRIKKMELLFQHGAGRQQHNSVKRNSEHIISYSNSSSILLSSPPNKRWQAL